MTRILSFHGDEAVKDRALKALRRHVAGGTFQLHPRWTGDRGNLVGVITESDDPDLFSNLLGYPPPLVLALERWIAAFRSTDAGAKFAERWFLETPVGADLTTTPSTMVIDMLEDAQLKGTSASSPAIEDARRAILDLHRAEERGVTSSRAEWKEARQNALAATDLAPTPLVKKAGAVTEAAAWPGHTRSVIYDTAGAFAAYRLAAMLAEIGWTDDDEGRLGQIMADQSRSPPSEIDGSKRDAISVILGRIDADFAARYEKRTLLVDSMHDFYAEIAARGLSHIKLLSTPALDPSA